MANCGAGCAARLGHVPEVRFLRLAACRHHISSILTKPLVCCDNGELRRRLRCSARSRTSVRSLRLTACRHHISSILTKPLVCCDNGELRRRLRCLARSRTRSTLPSPRRLRCQSISWGGKAILGGCCRRGLPSSWARFPCRGDAA